MVKEKQKIPVKGLLKTKRFQTVIKLILFFLCSFLISGVGLEEELFPFGIAFCAGVPFYVLLPASFGTVAGAFVFCNGLATLKYTGAVFLLFIVRSGLKGKIKQSKRLYYYPLFAFLCLLVSSLTVMLSSKPSLTDGILQLSDALIAGAGTCFFYRAFVLLFQSKKITVISSMDTAAVILTVSLLLAGCKILQIGSFSFARILAFYGVMLFSLCNKEGAGAMAGVGSGFIFGLSAEQPHLIYALPLAGLISGMCAETGNLAVAAGFTVSVLLSFLLKGNVQDIWIALAETVIAALLFIFTPKALTQKMLQKLSPFSHSAFTDESRETTGLYLETSAKAVRDMSESVREVCKLLARKDVPDFEQIIPQVKDEVCQSCLKQDFCWNKMQPKTQAAFESLLSSVTSFVSVTPESLPPQLKIVCCHRTGVLDAFDRYFREYSARNMARSEIFQAKLTAASQFTCAADILEDAAFQLKTAGKCDVKLSSVFRSCLEEAGFSYQRLSVLVNEAQRCTAQILRSAPPTKKECDTLYGLLTERANLQLMPPVIERYKPNGATLLICEQTVYTVDFFKLSRTGAGERFCGDTCEGFYDGRGNFICVLSDGMGTGTRAALDSVMTSSLMARLLRSGFSMDTAFYAVNTALLVKSADETLATLDILTVDLYTGECKLYKAGGSFSVLRKGNKTVIAEKASMPLGILKELKVNRAQTVLNAQDAVLMLSDGAGTLSPLFFKELFERHKNADAKEYCRLVVEAAVNGSVSGKADDITAACIILKQK